MKFFDGLKFKAYLVKVNWDGFCFTSNPNDALAHFLKIVNKLDKHVPYKIKKKISKNIVKSKKCTYLTLTLETITQFSFL